MVILAVMMMSTAAFGKGLVKYNFNMIELDRKLVHISCGFNGIVNDISGKGYGVIEGDMIKFASLDDGHIYWLPIAKCWMKTVDAYPKVIKK